MQSYTIIQASHAERLTLTIPPELQGKRLTITIAEAEEGVRPLRRNADLLEILLSAPTLSDNELQGFAEARTHLNEWGKRDSA